MYIQTVRIDHREKPSIVKKAFDYFNNIEITQLPVGDFVCGNVCVERKSIPDFTGSINNGRLNNQATNMVANYGEHSYIIIVGSLNELEENKYIKRWSELRFDREVAILNADHPKIHIELVANEKRFFKRVQALFKYCNDGSRKVNDIKKIAPRSDNKYVDMIRVVDGVGQKKAEDILKQFKIYELWDISEKDLRNSVKGIGAKQAENIKKVFHR